VHMPEATLVSQRPPQEARIQPNDVFTFRCSKELDCFTLCCRNVSIVLTPYDVLRMKRALRLNSSEFLDKYTVAMNTRGKRLPVLILKMEGEQLQCPFVTQEGCSIYRHRPWACRMYPLGLAEPRHPASGEAKFYFTLNEGGCHGHGKGEACQAQSWIASQELEDYESMGASFKELMLNEFWDQDVALPPEKMGMYLMACYDLDRFRRFIFETSFLDRFEMDEARIEAIRTDDEELLEVAMEWLGFVLFGAKTMKLRKNSLPKG